MLSSQKSPISWLQELMQGNGIALPVYNMSKDYGKTDAEHLFVCTVEVKGIIAKGHASTKQVAKNNAAIDALEKLGYKKQPDPIPQVAIYPIKSPMPEQVAGSFKNYISALNENAQKNGFQVPTYNINLASGGFIATCEYLNYTTQGFNISKKEAKQNAAKSMLFILEQNPVTHKPKPIQCIDDQLENVIRKYEAISINSMKPPTSNVLITKQNVSVPFTKHILNAKNKTVSDLKQELANLNITYSLKEIQKDPSIVKFTIANTDLNFFGTGKTKEEAVLSVLETSIGLINSGYLNEQIF